MSDTNLTYVYRHLENITQAVGILSDQVEIVDSNIQLLSANLQQLSDEFQTFKYKYTLNTELQLAETRILNVRQRLDKEFGHYGEVRRHTIGILQAVDISLVRQETIKYMTEELMLATPRYWLAPALIALSAWINNDKDLGQRAVLEGIKRNDEKTSLFFSLVSRRANRYIASRAWLDRYFSLYNPTSLPRHISLVVDAYANGIFGPDTDGMCIKRFRSWINELSSISGFEEKQIDQWKNAILSIKPTFSDDKFPYLRKYSSTWPQLEKCMDGVCLHQQVYNHFSGIFNGKVIPTQGILDAVDNMLDTLVTEFDEEELPLRKEEHFLELIIKENGDKAAAERRFDLEKETVEEMVSFTQILANMAIHPNTVHSTLSGQRLASALSKKWIVQAHQTLTAENQASVPHTIDLNVDSWSGVTVDGGNEVELIGSLKSHFNQELKSALVKIKIQPFDYVLLIGGIILFFIGFVGLNILMIILGACGILWYYLSGKRVKRKKDEVKKQFKQMHKDAQGVLRALIAEVVDWRTAYLKEDQKEVQIRDFFDSVSAEQFVGCNMILVEQLNSSGRN